MLMNAFNLADNKVDPDSKKVNLKERTGIVAATVDPANRKTDKVEELKKMLKGNTAREKLIDFNKRTKIKLTTFNITPIHAGRMIASLLNSEIK